MHQPSQSDDSQYDESDVPSPTFAQMGVSYTPMVHPETGALGGYSFLHASTKSVGVDHDVITKTKISFRLTGAVKGLVEGKPLTIVVGTTYGNRYDILMEKKVDVRDNSFSFDLSRGRFFLKTEGVGYSLPGVRSIAYPCKKRFCPFINGAAGSVLEVEPTQGDGKLYTYNWRLQNASQFGVESLNVVGSDVASLVNAENPAIMERTDGTDAATKLKVFYGIELHGVWGSEYASRLLSVVNELSWLNGRQDVDKSHQKWILTDKKYHPQDVKIVRFADTGAEKAAEEVHDLAKDAKYQQVVYISREAFQYARRRAVERKQNGFYFSRRLFKAVVRALCLHDPSRMKRMFKEMHNVDILDPHELFHHERAGRKIVAYPHDEYQSWFKHPEELVELATSWSEYPKGMHKIQGLKYLVRRLDGTVNPQSPTAPAIAYPAGPNVDSYIEFMESGFYRYQDVPQLVLHELAHFIHKNMLPENMQNEWIELGKWRPDAINPSLWHTRLQTQFVSAYAHAKGPDEDFASSVADYVLNPNLLRSRAMVKYVFLQKKVFGGSQYVTKSSHEFSVINLGNRDFFYPGRIASIDVKVYGDLREDKRVVVRMELSKASSTSCAHTANFRLTSESGTFHDVAIYSDKGCSNVLSGEFVMGKSLKRGIWTTSQIVLTDTNMLRRFVGMDDFGMRVWLNNAMEDYQEPRVITPSIAVALVKNGGSNLVRTSWLAVDDGDLHPTMAGYVALAGSATGQHALTGYSMGDYRVESNVGPFRSGAWTGARKVPVRLCEEDSILRDAEVARLPKGAVNRFVYGNESDFKGLSRADVAANVYSCFRVAVNIPLSDAARSGSYRLTRLISTDSAGNVQALQWPEAKGPSVEFVTRKVPDNSPPQVRNVAVTSRPMNSSSPDGETLVTIRFEVGDESGLAQLRCKIVDPFGAVTFVYPNRSEVKGWQRIFHEFVLPKGSIPGVWYLAAIRAEDHAGNELDARLTENILVTASDEVQRRR